MFIFNKKSNKAFTLIELLVVVAIIGLLSSVVFASLQSARSKAKNAQRKTELNQISKALDLYFDKYGTYPPFPFSTAQPPDSGGTYVDNFNRMADLLVNEKFLSKRPVSPCGPTCPASQGGYEYYYYYYAPYFKALTITRLENSPASTTGESGSCRMAPLPPDLPTYTGRFCDNVSSTYEYCLCNSK